LPPLRVSEVVFLGDSITAGWTFIEQHGFRNLGDGGKTTAHMINRLVHGCWYGEVCDQAPVLNMSIRILHLMGGTNDLAGNGGFYPSVDDIARNLANISSIATAHGVRVLLASVLPASDFYWQPEAPPPSARIVQLNALLAAFANTTANVTFVDYHTPLTNDVGGMTSAFTTDGVHVSASGYGVMQSVLQPHLFYS
jgi:lysophospholipase L1-like esterase